MASGRVKQYRAYVDTSVFGGTQDKEFREASTSFFQKVSKGHFRVLIPPFVLDELKTAPKAVQQVLDSVPGDLLELIAADDQVKQLAKAYLQTGHTKVRSILRYQKPCGKERIWRILQTKERARFLMK